MDEKLTRIHKFNFRYFLLKVVERIAFSAYYRKVVVRGRENIPYGNPIIFTPNHQNALMDALAVLNTCGLNTVFMARADIFRNKRQADILTFLKILPIYRQRDGTEELSKNNDIFDLALTILENKESVCLMPEGNHHHQRRLRPLVKGSFRIAFHAQEKFGDTLSVKIMPVGIDYDHYQNIHKDILINYGQAIDVKEFMDQYRENPARAINALKDRLSEELKLLMIHIKNEEYYDTYHELRFLYNRRMRNRLCIFQKSHYYRFLADKEMIHILDEEFILNPDEMKDFSSRVLEYSSGVKKLKLRNWIFDNHGYTLTEIMIRSIRLIIGFPVFIAGWLINYIPYTFPQRMIRNVKDPQFHASFKFGIAMLFFPVYYILLAGIVAIITRPAWIPLTFIPFGVLSGYFALYYSFWYKKLMAAIKYRRLIKKSDPGINNLAKLHETIITTMNKVVENYFLRYIPETKK